MCITSLINNIDLFFGNMKERYDIPFGAFTDCDDPVGILTGFTKLVCIYFAIDIVIIFRIS